MSRARKTIVILAFAIVFLFPAFAEDASAEFSIDLATFGVGFMCVGDTSIGALFNNGAARCDPDGVDNLFTNAACTYENIIDQILGRLYCGMQYRLFEPLSALMTLFVIMVGAGFALGIIPGTPREAVLAIFKFGLVYYFATESQLTIGVLYYGLMSFVQESINLFLPLLAPTATCISCPGGIFDQMDAIVGEFAINAGISQGGGAPCQNGLVAMFMTFMASVPMLAMIGIAMAFQFIMVFFQMILGYFLAITGIMFLIALSPFFLSFALFRFTRNYFDKWAMYLLSFSIQICVVVAFMGVIISLNLYEDLRQLYGLAQPYNVAHQAEGVRLPYREWCNICTPGEFGAFGITCAGGDIHPNSLLSNPDAVSIFSTRLLKILILAYVLHKAMLLVPRVAVALGSLPHAPQLVSTDQFMSGRGIRYPGMGAAQGAMQNFSGGTSVIDGVRRIFNPLVAIR